MKLKDLKNFDVEKFDWVAFSKKMMAPRPLIFLGKPKKKIGEVYYAGFTDRMFAITVDVILLYLLLWPLFNWISNVTFPGIDQEKVIQQFNLYAEGFVNQQVTIQQIGKELWSSSIVSKMLFDCFVQTIITGLLIIFVWQKYATTPGMKLFCMYIADAETGAKPTLKQSIIRYIGVVLAMIPLTFGMVWILFDKRNQGWQDKLANTVVLQKESQWPWERKKAVE